MTVTVGKLLNPRYYLFHAQRAVRRPAWRRRIGGMVSGLKQPRAFAAAVDPALTGKLEREGFCWLGEVLSADQVAEVRAFLETKTVSNFYRPGDGAFLPRDEAARNPVTHVANHAITDVLAAPHLLALANRPEILGLVEEHLACKPFITSISAWWSYSTSVGPQHAELFHRDIDDWRFIKFFVYLTDVGADHGPHVYIKNSAASEKLWSSERYTDEEVLAAFGAENRLELSAPAGSGFIENTSGLHKGTPVKNGIRLLFQVVYGLSPLPDTPRKRSMTLADAQARHGIALDAHVNRFILD